MNYIELFAGCGGLTLGLESVGFELLVANELSPMAAETFAHNILRVTLGEKGFELERTTPIYWISSQHSRKDLNKRLSENPYEAAGLSAESDLKDLGLKAKELRGSLLVGSIVDLNTILAKDSALAKSLKNGLGDGGVDLVSGGPPCQSFSMAGLRQKGNPRNSLPWAFAEFVRETNPKIALLENVSGILRAFNQDGDQYFAWYEVAKAFAVEGYVPLCLHVNAKYAGAAQNRPRFIMIALREDVTSDLLRSTADENFLHALVGSLGFYHLVNDKGVDTNIGLLKCHEIESEDLIFKSPILAPLTRYKGKEFTVRDAIDDLNGGDVKESKYVRLVNRTFKDIIGSLDGEDDNNRPPTNVPRVKSRFRLYQVMNKLDKAGHKEVSEFIKAADTAKLTPSEIRKLGDKISDETIRQLKKKENWQLGLDTEMFVPGSRDDTINFLARLHTKKQTQKALVPDQPAPAALSIPDDACHYHESTEQRTLTVREMARFQSFPDGFEFKSKVTTGGQMRKFQVPQYTQVGNAVPPMLGRALGEVCKSLLDLAALD